MKKSIILLKIDLNYAKQQGIKYCLIPVFKKDIEVVKKIKGEVKATITEVRNLLHHRKIFAIANVCCENNIFELLIKKWESIKIVFDFPLDVDFKTIDLLRFKYKDDSYTLIYICKWLFLPLDEILLPNGEIVNAVSSIDFASMDQIDFEKFYKDCLDLWSFALNVKRTDLESH